MSRLDKVVFIIENGAIVETTLRNLMDRFVDETTTPQGVGARYHLRGTQLWTWGFNGNSPELISEHETEQEAQEALDETFYTDYCNASEVGDFSSREDAEEYLRDIEY